MFASTRAAMIARLLLLGAAALSLGAQSSCSNNGGEGIFTLGDPGSGAATGSGPTFSVTLALKDSAGRTTGRLARGELITFELAVRNRTNAAVRLQLPTLGGNQDFQVFERGAPEAEWDWLADKLFPAVVTDITIDAGATQVFSGAWDQVLPGGGMLPPGAYEAQGRFFVVPGRGPMLTEEDTRSPRVRFIVN